MDILSRRIRELRVDHDMKQGEMGAALGITQNMVSNYENGREPPIETILAYADFFKVSVEYLLGITNEKNRVQSQSEKLIDEMQKMATERGETPFTRNDVAQLATAFVDYYNAGAPTGSAPMDCIVAFLPAIRRVLDAACSRNVAALIAASNDVANAGLNITAALGNMLGGMDQTERNN